MKAASTKIWPLAALRTLALACQGLAGASGRRAKPSLVAIARVFESLGCVQMDTLQMVQRSHYLAIWSRLGNYDQADLDALVYDPTRRRLFEGWQHAASLIPLRDWRFQLPHMRRVRQSPAAYTARWLQSEENRRLVEETLERVRREGPLRAVDFEYHGPRRGSWWDWKPAKMALEHLVAIGELMITKRTHFQREYELTDRVLPPWVDRSEPSLEERDRFWLEQAARLLGAATPRQIAWYYYHYLRKGQAGTILEEFEREGRLVPVQGFLQDGSTSQLLVHRDNLPLLEQAADGALAARRTTFLNPFDSLFWAKGRDLALWGMRQALEAYKPAAQRTWGYFCMPILYRDGLVGRFDPKLERKEGTLRLKALYLEEGVKPDERLVHSVARAMADFMAFHGARQLVIERSLPAEFGPKLERAI